MQSSHYGKDKNGMSKNKKLAILFIAGCVCVVAVALGVWFYGKKNGTSTGTGKSVPFTMTTTESDTICKGVTIGGLDVGGLTKEQAEERLLAYMESLRHRMVTITVDKHQVETQAEELGFSCTLGDVISQAYHIGRDGNIFTNFQSLSAEDKAQGKGQLSLPCQVAEDVLKNFVKKHCTSFVVKAKSSKLKFKNGTFLATESREGKRVKVKETAEAVCNALTEELSEEPLQIAAVVDVSKPKYTKEQVEKCKDLIGSFSTSYSSSTAARANNVKTAANYINGTILYPGQKFSVVKTIKDRTEENGYQPAPEYSSGTVVVGIGGGVCQVSTTLYNAVINAELEVIERSPHSMMVSYVDVSRDAAISGNYKDFKFKNNTEVPIYIAASAENGTLSFQIYGEETRPGNRKIKFESKILETLEPGSPVIRVDSSKPEGYRAVTQSAHTGYRAELWKVIYVDGKETDRVRINNSVYGAEPQHITVGRSHTSETVATKSPKQTEVPTEEPTKEPKQTEKVKEKQPSQQKKESEASKTTKPTKTPKEEPEPEKVPEKIPEKVEEPKEPEPAESEREPEPEPETPSEPEPEPETPAKPEQTEENTESEQTETSGETATDVAEETAE